jgi:hypothetical protein
MDDASLGFKVCVSVHLQTFNKTFNQMQQSIVKFISLSHRRCSTCFGHYYAHHQEPPQTAFAASGFRVNAEVDVFPAVIDHLCKHDLQFSATAVRRYSNTTQ